MKFIKQAFIFLCEKLIDFFYPKQCINCGKIDNEIICKRCYKKMIIIPQIIKYNNFYFNEHMYIFNYDNNIRKIILDYKFNDKAYLRDFFVKIITKNKKICRKLKKYDIIISVPIHNKRKKERGYNQSDLIAKKIESKINEIRYENKILIKEKNTIPQSTLNKKERIQNAKGVYKLVDIQKIQNKKIVLFDDIYTTGSTANECAKVLIENGAKEVLVFTIAKD